ncbi:MAG: VWA domain-containing protein [Bdellovibrionaceae bacterium]|nr:VWA domain-containing protein [Bdellovibrionales bacterium]MCB9254891.1 VWA domain-containing protein [Pseudobdellovibrionaceae bacterium]
MYLITPFALLLLLLPIGLAVFFLFKRRSTSGKLILPFSSLTIRRHTTRNAKYVHRALFGATVLALLLIVVSIARPAKRHLWAEKWAEGIDIVLTLDVSESMDATDFKPNRIVVAKQVIRDFIEKRDTDRIGLVTFGGEAVTKCPLTRDYDFLKKQLEEVELRELKQGTAIGMALTNAVGRLRGSTAKSKVIVLITDGDSNVGAINPITASNLAKEEGIRIYAIGIGKNSRVLVPIYAYDIMGKRTHLLTHIPSYLNPDLLKEIAGLTGAKSYMAKDEGSLAAILSEIDQLEKSKVKVTPKSRTEELYFWIALAATVLMFVTYLLQELRYWRASPRYAASISKP